MFGLRLNSVPVNTVAAKQTSFAGYPPSPPPGCVVRSEGSTLWRLHALQLSWVVDELSAANVHVPTLRQALL